MFSSSLECLLISALIARASRQLPVVLMMKEAQVMSLVANYNHINFDYTIISTTPHIIGRILPTAYYKLCPLEFCTHRQ